MLRKTILFSAILIFTIAGFYSTVMAQAAFDANSAMGSILNPMPGEEINDRQPMIAVQLPQPDPPIDIDSIKIFVDGDNVTAETQLSVEYIFYEPQVQMAMGTHNVTVSYQDIKKNSIPALSWSFRIVKVQAVARTRRAGATKRQQISTSGRLTLKFKDIFLNESDRGGNWAYTDIKYQEAHPITGSLDINHENHGRLTNFKYNRNVEQIRGRFNDEFSFTFKDKYNKNRTDQTIIGDYGIDALYRGAGYMNPSIRKQWQDIAITGVKMRGFARSKTYGKYKIYSFAGRSRAPHNGRLKRNTVGVRVDTRTSRNHDVRFTALQSNEKNLSGSSSNPNKDTVYSARSLFKYSDYLSLDSELALNNHSETNSTIPSDSGNDSASYVQLNYKDGPVGMHMGRWTIGPRYNPTVLGTFVGTDKEGTGASFDYVRPSGRFKFNHAYQVYHNNLHHDANTDNVTDQTRNSKSSMTLDYGFFLPRLDFSYLKQYLKSKQILGNPEYKQGESTNFRLKAMKKFNDTSTFSGTLLTGTLSRYDNDRLTYSGGTAYDTMSRSDTRIWTLSTRYKGFAQISYNTVLTKSWSRSGTADYSIVASKANTEYLGLQLTIVPFKFITNLNYRRSGSKSNTYSYNSASLVGSSSLTSAPLEYQHTVTMIYYLDKKQKLQVEFINYDKDYRAAVNRGKAFDEQSIEMGYSLDF